MMFDNVWDEGKSHPRVVTSRQRTLPTVKETETLRPHTAAILSSSIPDCPYVFRAPPCSASLPPHPYQNAMFRLQQTHTIPSEQVLRYLPRAHSAWNRECSYRQEDPTTCTVVEGSSKRRDIRTVKNQKVAHPERAKSGSSCSLGLKQTRGRHRVHTATAAAAAAAVDSTPGVNHRFPLQRASYSAHVRMDGSHKNFSRRPVSAVIDTVPCEGLRNTVADSPTCDNSQHRFMNMTNVTTKLHPGRYPLEAQGPNMDGGMSRTTMMGISADKLKQSRATSNLVWHAHQGDWVDSENVSEKASSSLQDSFPSSSRTLPPSLATRGNVSTRTHRTVGIEKVVCSTRVGSARQRLTSDLSFKGCYQHDGEDTEYTDHQEEVSDECQDLWVEGREAGAYRITCERVVATVVTESRLRETTMQTERVLFFETIHEPFLRLLIEMAWLAEGQFLHSVRRLRVMTGVAASLDLVHLHAMCTTLGQQICLREKILLRERVERKYLFHYCPSRFFRMAPTLASQKMSYASQIENGLKVTRPQLQSETTTTEIKTGMAGNVSFSGIAPTQSWYVAPKALQHQVRKDEDVMESSDKEEEEEGNESDNNSFPKQTSLIYSSMRERNIRLEDKRPVPLQSTREATLYGSGTKLGDMPRRARLQTNDIMGQRLLIERQTRLEQMEVAARWRLYEAEWGNDWWRTLRVALEQTEATLRCHVKDTEWEHRSILYSIFARSIRERSYFISMVSLNELHQNGVRSRRGPIQGPTTHRHATMSPEAFSSARDLLSTKSSTSTLPSLSFAEGRSLVHTIIKAQAAQKETSEIPCALDHKSVGSHPQIVPLGRNLPPLAIPPRPAKQDSERQANQSDPSHPNECTASEDALRRSTSMTNVGVRIATSLIPTTMLPDDDTADAHLLDQIWKNDEEVLTEQYHMWRRWLGYSVSGGGLASVSSHQLQTPNHLWVVQIVFDEEVHRLYTLANESKHWLLLSSQEKKNRRSVRPETSRKTDAHWFLTAAEEQAEEQRSQAEFDVFLRTLFRPAGLQQNRTHGSGFEYSRIFSSEGDEARGHQNRLLMLHSESNPRVVRKEAVVTSQKKVVFPEERERMVLGEHFWRSGCECLERMLRRDFLVVAHEKLLKQRAADRGVGGFLRRKLNGIFAAASSQVPSIAIT